MANIKIYDTGLDTYNLYSFQKIPAPYNMPWKILAVTDKQYMLVKHFWEHEHDFRICPVYHKADLLC
jgi:hypothetical protein